MKGYELIDWIIKNNAEDKNFVVQYRDCHGDWTGTEEPYLKVKTTLKYNDETLKWNNEIDENTILL